MKKIIKNILPALVWFLATPSAVATTGLSSLAGLAEFFLLLLYLAGYMVVFLLLLVFVGGRKVKLFFILAFFSGLLFMPPFQAINLVSFHYVKAVSNLAV